MLRFALKSLIQLAAVSRLILFIVQVIFDACFEDFDTSTNQITLFEANISKSQSNIGRKIFNGVNKWDSVYFTYISIHGYEYEQMLAFYPGFPLLLNLFSRLTAGLFTCEYLTTCITSFFMNSFFFVVSTYYLYQLTDGIFGKKMAAVSSFLFIINPANVFMISSYSESLYSCLQFILLYYLERNHFLSACTFICLSIITRSNGILNIAFLTHFFLKRNAKTLIRQFSNKPALLIFFLQPNNLLLTLINCLRFVLPLCFYLSGPAIVFAIHIFWVYDNYCHYNHVVSSSSHWCYNKIPLSYSYVQHKYWNVGLLKYFDTKQIPNFLLASPVILIVVIGLKKFASLQNSYLAIKSLGLIDTENSHVEGESLKNPSDIFVYLTHCLFLTSFGLVAFHVQILTRMLFSSCPFLYWTLASIFIDNKTHNVMRTCIVIYFVIYNITGVILHCNFYPWT